MILAAMYLLYLTGRLVWGPFRASGRQKFRIAYGFVLP